MQCMYICQIDNSNTYRTNKTQSSSRSDKISHAQLDVHTPTQLTFAAAGIAATTTERMQVHGGQLHAQADRKEVLLFVPLKVKFFITNLVSD
ncbi:hypothetical protein CHUAL_010285 [Chamberlinius hualienensis]